ncbi:MAG: hypothetical protein ABI162_14855 [Luteolibacter sp.]
MTLVRCLTWTACSPLPLPLSPRSPLRAVVASRLAHAKAAGCAQSKASRHPISQILMRASIGNPQGLNGKSLNRKGAKVTKEREVR